MQDARVMALRAAWPVARVLSTHDRLPTSHARRTKCPFCYHDQRTPSLTFSFRNDLFKCHRCGVGGDSVSLWMMLNGQTFRQATVSMGIEEWMPDESTMDEEMLWRQAPILTYQDLEQEEEDYLRLSRLTLRDRNAELAEIKTRQKMGELTEDDAAMERGACLYFYDETLSWIDEAHVEIMYYLKRLVEEEGSSCRPSPTPATRRG